jgi:outer membrane protein assembly factor BamB
VDIKIMKFFTKILLTSLLLTLLVSESFAIQEVNGQVKWIHDLGVTILSSPVISDGAVFIIAEKAEEVDLYGTGDMIVFYSTWIYAVNKEDGRINWGSLIVEGDKSDSAEVVRTGDDVYALANTRGNEIVISKLAISDGTSRWNRKEIIKDAAFIGAAATADILGLVTKQTNGAYKFSALRAENGHSIWSDSLNGITTPPIAIGDKFCYLESGVKNPMPPYLQENVSLVLRKAENGALNSSSRTGFEELAGKPFLKGNAIYVTGMWAMNRYKIEKYDLEKINAGRVWAWDTWLGDEDIPVSGFAFTGDYLVYPGIFGKPYVLRVTDGKPVEIDGSVTGAIVSPPLASDDGIYFLLDNRRMEFIGSDGELIIGPSGLVSSWNPIRGNFAVSSGNIIYVAILGGSLVAIETE